MSVDKGQPVYVVQQQQQQQQQGGFPRWCLWLVIGGGILFACLCLVAVGFFFLLPLMG